MGLEEDVLVEADIFLHLPTYNNMNLLRNALIQSKVMGTLLIINRKVPKLSLLGPMNHLLKTIGWRMSDN